MILSLKYKHLYKINLNIFIYAETTIQAAEKIFANVLEMQHIII